MDTTYACAVAILRRILQNERGHRRKMQFSCTLAAARPVPSTARGDPPRPESSATTGTFLNGAAFVAAAESESHARRLAAAFAVTLREQRPHIQRTRRTAHGCYWLDGVALIPALVEQITAPPKATAALHLYP